MGTPEQLARRNVAQMLEDAGWSVQDMKGLLERNAAALLLASGVVAGALVRWS